jgi:hypothetical protein
VNVDKTGVSMSWKTAWAAIGTIVAGAVAWTVFTATLSRKADLGAHDLSVDAHPITLTQGEAPASMPRLIVKHEQDHRQIVQDVAKLESKVNTNGGALTTVRNGFFDQRAEDLAYRAVDQLPKTVPPRQRVETWNRIKSRAKANLEAERDIRDGLGEIGY